MYDKLMNTDKNKEQFLLNEYQNMSILAALSTRDKKNPVYIKSPAKEKEARLKFNLRKPDEQVVVLPSDERARGAVTASAAPTNLANWQKWWNYFFNKYD